MRIRYSGGLIFVLVLLVGDSVSAFAQQAPPSGAPLTVQTTTLPKGYLQTLYRFEMHAEGGITPLNWKLTSGALPKGVRLEPYGVLEGMPTQTGEFSFSATVTDSGIPKRQIIEEFHLLVLTPLVVLWGRYPKVTASRVDGAIKVSNPTGEDFDLTMIVLAVNENGRATAIGYQHFPLKRNTIDFEIPFGENLPYGAYNVNVDVVAEVAPINSIFRGRLMANVRVLQAP
ncbi:MAG: putative Ig domain-containing protein [Terriglobales bacterium]